MVNRRLRGVTSAPSPRPQEAGGTAERPPRGAFSTDEAFTYAGQPAIRAEIAAWQRDTMTLEEILRRLPRPSYEWTQEHARLLPFARYAMWVQQLGRMRALEFMQLCESQQLHSAGVLPILERARAYYGVGLRFDSPPWLLAHLVSVRLITARQFHALQNGSHLLTTYLGPDGDSYALFPPAVRDQLQRYIALHALVGEDPVAQGLQDDLDVWAEMASPPPIRGKLAAPSIAAPLPQRSRLRRFWTKQNP